MSNFMPKTTSRFVRAIAMAATVVLWSVFALSVRGIGASSLTTVDAAFVRFLVPLLVLAPWVRRAVRNVRREKPSVVAALCFGAGLPYFGIAAWGGKLTSAALVGMVIQGTVPLFVFVLSAMLWRARASRAQMLALASIVAGVGITVLASPSAGAVGGIMVLLAAGVIWSVYTLALKHTGLNPVDAVIVLCVPSVAVCVLAMGAGLMPSNLMHGAAAGGDILAFTLAQGVGVGVGAALAYTVAIRALGSREAATFGASSPVLTALVAVPLFGETPSAATWVSMAFTVVGVVAFNRVRVAVAQPARNEEHVLGPSQNMRRDMAPASVTH